MAQHDDFPLMAAIPDSALITYHWHMIISCVQLVGSTGAVSLRDTLPVFRYMCSFVLLIISTIPLGKQPPSHTNAFENEFNKTFECI